VFATRLELRLWQEDVVAVGRLSTNRPFFCISVNTIHCTCTAAACILVTLDVSPTVFEILTFIARKWLVSLFDAPAQGGGALEFLYETYPAKIRAMGLPYGEI